MSIKDEINSEEFFNLMQAYRWAPAGRQENVIDAFEAVKAFAVAAAEAKISKACELLKKARPGMFTSNPSLTVAENVDAFLREAGHE